MTARSVPDLDAAIITAAQGGDAAALTQIYTHYGNRIFTLVYRLVPRRAQAEDLMHEVFLEVLRGITHFAGTGSFGGWLHTIAVNKCLSHLRSPWRRSMLWLDDDSATDIRIDPIAPPDADHALRTELDAALRQLPPLSRAVVWLHDVEGYTHIEIARQLGRTVSFSKSQLARAHARLRELLVDHEASPSEDLPEAMSCTPATQSLSPSS